MALVQCKECGENVSTKANKCPHCGSPLSISKIKRTSFGLITTIIIGVLLVIGFLGILLIDNKGEDQTDYMTSNPDIKKSKSNTLSAGDEAILGFDNDKGAVVVFLTELGIYEYSTAIKSKNPLEFDQIMLEGKGFLVKSGTRVSIIGFGGFDKGALKSYQVFILDDELHMERSGWVPYEWVKSMN